MITEKAVLILSCAIALNALANIYFIRRAKNIAVTIDHSVTVLIPLRNEIENLNHLIDSLRYQRGIREIHFYVIDDNSTDGTKELAQQLIKDDARFTLISSRPLPHDWLGKPFALQQGFLKTKADVIVTIDADVRLQPYAIAQSVSLLYTLRFDFLSCYPKQIAITASERIIQPLLQWSWIATVPLRIAEKTKLPSMAIANGQFFVSRIGALQKIGGFQSVRRSVLDDIELARTLLRSGYQGAVIEASAIASCRMYSSWSGIKAGYGKSLRTAFSGFFGSLIAILFLFLTGILPVLLFLSGSILGGVAFLLLLLSRCVSARLSRGRIFDSILHPISSLLLIFLILYSTFARKSITWKGRSL